MRTLAKNNTNNREWIRENILKIKSNMQWITAITMVTIMDSRIQRGIYTPYSPTPCNDKDSGMDLTELELN